MNFVIDGLRNNPELAIFLTLAVGFLIGRMKFGSFSLGIVVGTLLAGVVIGQLDIKVSPLVKTVFFDLFLFTTGYKVGPQFFRGLSRDAIPQVALTVVLCVTCLLAAFVFRFWVETVRGNEVQAFGLTGPQLVLIPLLALLVMHFARRIGSGVYRVPAAPAPMPRSWGGEGGTA